MDTILASLFNQQSGSKYVRVCNTVQSAIKQGVLQGGDQLPPQRELADILGVTLGTVTRGYKEAEKRGLVTGETGRGTFVRVGDGEQYTLHGRHNSAAGSSALIPMDLNFPMVDGLPQIGGVLREIASQSSLSELMCYQQAGGMPRHREGARQWLSSCGVEAGAGQVFITAGAQHAIQTALQVNYNGEGALAVEHFTYPGVMNSAKISGRPLAPIGMDDQGMRPEALEAQCKQQKIAGIYIMPTIQNPTTVCMGEARRQELIAVAREYDLFIIEDEVYAPFEAGRPTPVRESAPERTYYISGLSKVLAPGLRIGFMVVPEGKERLAAAAMSSSIWMAPPLMAEIACRWIMDGTASAVADRKREAAARRRKIVSDALGSGPTQFKAGGLHAWLELPAWWQSELFVQEAAVGGVAILPASSFCPSRRPRCEAVRICFGAPADDVAVAQGAGILSQLMAERLFPEAAVL